MNWLRNKQFWSHGLEDRLLFTDILLKAQQQILICCCNFSCNSEIMMGFLRLLM